MSSIQEAYILMQRQPESNLRIIIELLRKMTPKTARAAKPAKRTGIGNSKFHLDDDFDTNFDALDSEIAADFYGEGR